MQFKDKINQSVADAVAKIMGEALHPNQQKLDVHEPEKDKLTAKDFEMLRKGKKAVTKEEVEQVEEGMSHQAKTTMKHIPNASPALKKASTLIKPGVAGYPDRAAVLKAAGVKDDRGPRGVTKEEVENLDEVKMADLPSTKVQGRAYGSSKPQPSALDLVKGPKEKELKSIESEKKKTIKEEDAYDKHMKPSDKPHDKDAAKKRAQDAAVAARKAMTKEEVELQEKLSASADAGDYIKDFQKSDAPQFQGKSPEKRRIMGIAAYLAAKRGK
jgi:hypothetical protein